MTIKSFDTRNEYTGSGGQTVFNFTFKIFSAADISVYITPAGNDYDDSAYLTTAYTVDPSSIGNADGGFITLDSGVTAGDRVTLVSNIGYKRDTDYQNSGDFLPAVVNNDFDRVVSLVKQVKDRSDRTLAFEESAQNLTQRSLPTPSAGSFLVWDSAGNLVNASGTGADSALRTDLAVNDDATKGSALIGHYDSFAPTYLKTQSDINNGIPVSAFRFIASSKHAGIRAQTNTDDLTSNFSDITSSGARKITFPGGRYNFDSVTISDNFREWEGEIPNGVIFRGIADTSDVITISGNVVTLKNIRVTADTGVRNGSGNGIVIDQGEAFTQNRVNLLFCQVEDQPGDGIVGVKQEHGLYWNVWCEDNGGRGFYFHDDSANIGINCTFVNCRGIRNGGTYQWQITNQVGYTFINPQSLQGTGTAEMFLQSGTNHIVSNYDIERTTVAGLGLLCSTTKAQLIGGTIQKLLNGIQINSADDVIISQPRLIGDSGTPMAKGIEFVGASGHVDIETAATNVTTFVTKDSSSSVTQKIAGRFLDVDTRPREEIITYAAAVTPDSNTGYYKRMTLTGNVTINAPTNSNIGDELVFIIIQDGVGGHTVTWNSAYNFNTAWSDTGNTASTRTMVAFKYDGSEWNESMVQSAYH